VSKFYFVIVTLVLCAASQTTAQEKTSFKAADTFVEQIEFSKDGKKLITNGSERTIKAWDLDNKKLIYSLVYNSRSSVFFTEFVDSGEQILMMRADVENGFRGWEVVRCDIKTKKETALLASKDPDQPIALWGDRKTIVLYGKLPFGDNPYVIKFLNYETMEQLVVARPDSFEVMAFSPDRTLVALKEGRRLRVMDCTNNKEVSAFFAVQDINLTISRGAFLKDNETLVVLTTALSDGLQIWNTKTGKLIKTMKRIGCDEARPILSPDGRLLATYGRFDTMNFLDTKTLKYGPSHKLGYYCNGVEMALRFSPDGLKYAVSDDKGNVHILDTPKVERVQSRLARRLRGFFEEGC